VNVTERRKIGRHKSNKEIAILLSSRAKSETPQTSKQKLPTPDLCSESLNVSDVAFIC